MSSATISSELRARIGGVTVSGAALLSRVFLLDLRMAKLGTSRKAPVSLITTDADTDLVTLGKKILQCPELDAIKLHQGRVRSHIETLMIPTGDTFRSGMYLLPYSLLSDVEDYLHDAKTDMQALVDAFIAVYSQRVEDDREALKSLFDERNYPAEKKVRDSFVMDFEYVSLSTAEGLKEFSQELFDREKAKLEAKMETAAQESRVLIMEQAKQLALNVAERLTPGKDGKPKIFRDSLLSNWTDFLQTFSAKNITDDTELAAMMADVRDKLGGVGGDDIRKSEEVREDIRAYFEGITANLDGAITAKPIRRIRLADGDESETGTEAEAANAAS